MKKWTKYLLVISVLLLTVFQTLTVSAKDSGRAQLVQAEGSNDVTVTLELTEGKTEAITSLRFQIYVSQESGEMNKPEFVFDPLIENGAIVKDAEITWDEEHQDYIIDVVVSGYEDIFALDGAADGKALIGTVDMPEGNGYYAEVGLMAVQDAEMSAPILQYVDRVGAQTMAVHMTDAIPVYVGQKPEPEPAPVPTPEPEPTPTPDPTPTPTPTTPDPTPTPAPSPTPTTSDPTPTPTPTTPSPSPAPAPTPTPSPAPTPTPEPTPSPEPEPPVKNNMAAPKLTVTPVVGTKTLKFKWQKVAGAKGYQIYVYNAQSGNFVHKKTTKNTSYTASYSFGKSYRIKVRAYKTVKKKKVYSNFSREVTVQVPSFDKSKKAGISAAADAEKQEIRVSWKKVTGADGYVLYQYSAGKKKYTTLATIDTAAVTSYAGAAYKAGTSYRFKVRAFAYDTDGTTRILGRYSSAAQVTTAPVQVTGVSAKQTKSGKIQLTWKKVSGADGYQVYQYNAKSKKFKKLATVKKGTKTSYTLKSKSKNATAYRFKVRAYKNNEKNKKVYGSYSEELRMTTQPVRVTKVKASSAGAGSVKITWKRVSKAQGYQILRSTKKNSGYAEIAAVEGGSTVSYTDSALTGGKKYYYRVKAYVIDAQGKLVSGKNSAAGSATAK